MFIYLIFRKLGWKANKYRMALAYSLAYFLVFLAVLGLSALYLKSFSIHKTLIYSALVALTMFIVYLIKWHIFKMSLKG